MRPLGLEADAAEELRRHHAAVRPSPGVAVRLDRGVLALDEVGGHRLDEDPTHASVSQAAGRSHTVDSTIASGEVGAVGSAAAPGSHATGA